MIDNIPANDMLRRIEELERDVDDLEKLIDSSELIERLMKTLDKNRSAASAFARMIEYYSKSAGV